MPEKDQRSKGAEDRLKDVGLEMVGGVLVPKDRASEEGKHQEQMRELMKRYGTPEGLAELEGEVDKARSTLETWNQTHPVESEYLDCIEAWKQGWCPFLPEDVDAARAADARMRELEPQLGIEYSDLYMPNYSEEQLVEMGFSPQRITEIRTIIEGQNLRYALSSQTELLSLVRNLIQG